MKKLAAVDIGSNAARLALSDLDTLTPGGPVAQRLSRVPLGLGRDVFATGRIGPEREAMLLGCMRNFRDALRAWRANEWLAVGTSALREAANSPEILDRVRRDSGLHVELISGAEEGWLSGLAVRHRLPQLDPAAALVMDVGGGSTELGRLDDPDTTRSFALGTLRTPNLAEPGARATLEEMCGWGQRLLAGVPEPSRALAGLGGNINSAAQRLGYGPGRAVPRGELAAWATELRAMTAQERELRLGMTPDRAYALPQALELYLATMQALGVERILAPKVGVGDGLILRLRARLLQPPKA